MGSLSCMPLVTAHFTMSLDGFMAGPDQTEDVPLGVGGEDLHRWMFEEPRHEVDDEVAARILAPRGAYVMGRNMFGPVRGEWGDRDWRGWWGDEPPYHAPVFVLTHYPHDPIEMDGRDDVPLRRRLRRGAASGRSRPPSGDTVTIAGGASAVRQGLQAGVVDEVLVTHSPVSLGSGESPFDIPGLDLAPVEVLASPQATHVVYRVNRA